MGLPHDGQPSVWSGGYGGGGVKTIPRNHKAKIEGIKAKAVRCLVFSERNDFAGVEIDPVIAWEQLAKYDFARLVEHATKWQINIHGNLWYELRTAE